MSAVIYSFKNLSVEVDASTQWATVHDAQGAPAGTLLRRRRFEAAPEWRIYDMKGKLVGGGVLARSRLIELVRARTLAEEIQS